MNIGNSIIKSAEQFLGTPYLWGGTSPKGFDCSGLVQYVYNENGVNVPRTAKEQYNASRKITEGELQAGDLIFTGTGNNVTHVMLYAGEGRVIEAPHTGEVVRYSTLSGRNIIGYGRLTDGANSEDTQNAINLSTTSSGWLDNMFTSIVKIIAILLLVVGAIAFFMKAFEISII